MDDRTFFVVAYAGMWLAFAWSCFFVDRWWGRRRKMARQKARVGNG